MKKNNTIIATGDKINGQDIIIAEAAEPIIVKGFKVTNENNGCRGHVYELNKVYTHSGKIELCEQGFHFCLIAADCFNYYDFTPTNKVFEVEASGVVKHGDDKSVCNTIKLVREISWDEVLEICNQGANNTGLKNTGNWNTGNSNTGNRNTGNSNTGNSNTGNSNTGNSNTGNSNTSNSNTGDWNTGDWNTGNWNTGNWNTGNSNTGNRNTGNRNTGNSNTGNSNTGDSNTGDSNTGDWNTGNRNTGYSNTGNRNTGAFCTIDAPFPLFNKESNWTEKDFFESKAYQLLCNDVDTKIWVSDSMMTNEEKVAHPSYKTAEGYLKDIPFKEAFSNAWHNWNASNRNAFTDLPNFDKDIFLKITGVDIEK